MSELKPCPFCGSTNVELRKGMFWNGAVHCNDCSADVVFDAVELIAKGDYDWQEACKKAERLMAAIFAEPPKGDA